MTPEIKEWLLEIANEDVEDVYETYGAEGLWVTKDDLPSDPSHYSKQEYEKVFGPERAAVFQKGYPFSEPELDALREHRLAEIRLGSAYADAIPAYCLAEVTDDDDNSGVALILCTGDSFSELTIWVDDVLKQKLRPSIICNYMVGPAENGCADS